MGQILGLGMTHSPPLLAASGDTGARIKRMMDDPLLPACYRSPAAWPEPMRQQWDTFTSKELGIAVELNPGESKITEVFTPQQTGTFQITRGIHAVSAYGMEGFLEVTQ